MGDVPLNTLCPKNSGILMRYEDQIIAKNLRASTSLRRVTWLLCALSAGAVLAREQPAGRTVTFGPGMPAVEIRAAKTIAYPEAINPHRQAPFRVDSNAPSLWLDGKFVAFHSWEQIWRASGEGLDKLSSDQMTRFTNPKLNYLWFWLESAWDRNDGTIYGWYHQEIPNVCPPREGAAAPGYPVIAKIGAARSRDKGVTWDDLGYVIDGKDSGMKCQSGGAWYAGGAGDFNVYADPRGEYYYFYYSNFSTVLEEQGLAVARLSTTDLDNPGGRVQRWYKGQWSEPGLGGHATPIFPATADIYETQGQLFWGPVVHWNSYLGKYVMIVNRIRDSKWTTEGIYLSFSDDVSNPASWTTPVKIVDRDEAIRGDPSKARWNGWYAQLVGTAQGETDKQASQTARLFIDGVSRWEVTFRKP
jgi:hypothetical protein